MVDKTRKLVLGTGPRDNRRPLLNLFLWIFSSVLFGLAGLSTAKAADIERDRVTSVGPGAQFAVADFDGDLSPDIASVQSGQSNASGTDYWIRLQLSAARRESIRVVGPVGGLRIEARDVNGDHAVDLVLATAWLGQPVAIFLNDGHGRFSRVEPTAFPQAALSDSTTKWQSSPDRTTEAAGLPPQPHLWSCPEVAGLLHVWPRDSSIGLSAPGFLFFFFLISCAGRAPPSEILYL